MLKPQIASCSLEQAHQQALDTHEPMLVPISQYADDRGWSQMNLMQGVMNDQGQINISQVYPGVVKAWHRHQHQTDFWMCPLGHIKVGVHHEDGRTWQLVLGEKNPGILIIPPTLWHGLATVGPTSALMIYYVTHAYNPKSPDEERQNFDAVANMDWGIVHR